MNLKYGNLFVGTERGYYNPGELVKGNIYMYIHTEFNVWELFLKIKGIGTFIQTEKTEF